MVNCSWLSCGLVQLPVISSCYPFLCLIKEHFSIQWEYFHSYLSMKTTLNLFNTLKKQALKISHCRHFIQPWIVLLFFITTFPNSPPKLKTKKKNNNKKQKTNQPKPTTRKKYPQKQLSKIQVSKLWAKEIDKLFSYLYHNCQIKIQKFQILLLSCLFQLLFFSPLWYLPPQSMPSQTKIPILKGWSEPFSSMHGFAIDWVATFFFFFPKWSHFTNNSEHNVWFCCPHYYLLIL